jgi:putative ABC transport system permease protein
MLRNYYRTSIRNISRNRFHSSLNVLSLATGMAFTLLIASYIWGEWRVNRQLRHADRQYILNSNWKDPNMGVSQTTLGPLAKSLKENYPSLVANYCRFDGITSNVSFGDKHFRENIQLGDSSLLSMYGFTLLHGDAHTALTNPFTVVVTADMAIKYFGRIDAIGQNLSIENFSGGKKDFRVTGVLPAPSRNSVTWLDEANDNRIFIPSANLAFFGRNMDWPNIYIVSYIELQKGVSPASLKDPIAQLIKANTNPGISANLTVSALPLQSYYLTGNGGTVQKMLYTMSFIALFILLMALINFINLSISGSSARMKEIGIRKVLGGLRRQLIGQFLTESILLALIATGIALVLYPVFAPFLSAMLGKEVPGILALPTVAWVVIGALAILVGCLAGLYPALVLSSLPSVDSLKGKRGTIKENIFLRKGLVGFQFATATIVFVGALIISQQVRLFFSDQLGYNKEWVVSSQLPRDWSAQGVKRMEAIRKEFSVIPGVKDAALSYEIPNGNNGNSVGIYREGGDSAMSVISSMMISDEHYAATYQIPLAAGVFFNKEGEGSLQDSSRVVINETAAKALGWKDLRDAIGRRLQMFGRPGAFLTVSGVIKDFHFRGMGSPIDADIFMHVSLFNSYRYLSFKLWPGNMGTTLASLQRQWSTLLPGAPFEYRFMDETLQYVYQNELRLKKAASASTGLALLIVLLGVVGMLSHSVQKRTKEIAIRKVIGSSVAGIIRLFLREFLPLLFLAGLIATPLAWWMMQRWLNDYATRITITLWPFAMAVFSLGFVMVVLIVAQTIRAALANPVKSLKTE